MDTESAEIFDVQRINIAKTKAIEELLGTEYNTSTSSKIVTKKSLKIINRNKLSEKSIGNGITVTLLKCVKTLSTVKCDFIVRSEKSNFKNYLYRSSRIFDNMGNEHAAIKVVFGDSIAYGNNSSHAPKILPKNIPIKSSLEFSGITEDAEYLTMLEIHLGKSKVDFRDIVFTK